MAAERDDKKDDAPSYEHYQQLGRERGDSVALRAACDALDKLRALQSAVTAFSPPTEKEIAAYRDLFRRELDKNMHNSSGSPSTDAHHVALHAFVEARNRGARSAAAPRRCREGADRDCTPACDEKSRTYCSWKGF